jgi:hypothetical protein
MNTSILYFVIAFHKNYNSYPYPMGKGVEMEGGEFLFLSPSFPALFPS